MCHSSEQPRRLFRRRRSFRLSFPRALLGPTGAYWLDDPSDLTCKDRTQQYVVDDPLLSCKQVHPPDRAAAENAIQPEVLPQQQVDQHRQCHRGDKREQHHEEAAESATERADLQVPEAHAGWLIADRYRKPMRRHSGRWGTARRPLAAPTSGQPSPDSANRRRGRGSSKPLPLEDSFPEGERSRGRVPAVRVGWRRGRSRRWRLRGRWPRRRGDLGARRSGACGCRASRPGGQDLLPSGAWRCRLERLGG